MQKLEISFRRMVTTGDASIDWSVIAPSIHLILDLSIAYKKWKRIHKIKSCISISSLFKYVHQTIEILKMDLKRCKLQLKVDIPVNGVALLV